MACKGSIFFKESCSYLNCQHNISLASSTLTAAAGDVFYSSESKHRGSINAHRSGGTRYVGFILLVPAAHFTRFHIRSCGRDAGVVSND